MKISLQTDELLNDERICKDIARAHESLIRVVNQSVFDITTLDNMGVIGPYVFALKEFSALIHVFASKGKSLLLQEPKKSEQ